MTELRLATPDDADAIAGVFTASRNLLTFLPQLHTAEEDRGFIRGHILTRYRVTVATREGRILGFLSDEPGWIENLYVMPDALGGGIGSVLLADAMARNEALELWCFEENHRARRFYERHGFLEVLRTDGSDNEERCPDIRFRWLRLPDAP
jgi:putative acetyltransferase